MKWLVRLWRTPSAYRDDPRGYVRNQLGHAYLVGGALTTLLEIACRLMGLPTWPALLIVVAGYAVWEFTQWQWRRAEADDCLEDLAHVTLIALSAWTGELLLVVPQLMFTAAGYAWRHREQA